MECRLGCGACCIAPSINAALPGMPQGKPAGVRCAHLTIDNLCELFGTKARPAFCGEYQADEFFCGVNQQQALERIALLELETAVETKE